MPEPSLEENLKFLMELGFEPCTNAADVLKKGEHRLSVRGVMAGDWNEINLMLAEWGLL